MDTRGRQQCTSDSSSVRSSYCCNNVHSTASADSTGSQRTQLATHIPRLSIQVCNGISADDRLELTCLPDQARFDPFNADAGNGQFSNGTALSPPADPSRCYTRWNTTLARTWLAGLKNKPQILAIDNEIEIAHSTHQDMHPTPVNYDEELKRVIDFATAAKAALPNAAVAAPSTCSWWFCA